MRSVKISVIFAIALLLGCGTCYKILGILPTPAPSHYITGNALMEGLAAGGHEVTVISPFSHSKSLQNYRAIHLDGITEKLNGKKRTKLQYVFSI